MPFGGAEDWFSLGDSATQRHERHQHHQRHTDEELRLLDWSLSAQRNIQAEARRVRRIEAEQRVPWRRDYALLRREIENACARGSTALFYRGTADEHALVHVRFHGIRLYRDPSYGHWAFEFAGGPLGFTKWAQRQRAQLQTWEELE